MTKSKRPESNGQRGNKSNKQYDTSCNTQQARILSFLTQGHSLSTQDARCLLDVMHPAARIEELRKKGWNIVTHWTVVDTGKGLHRIAKYVLLSGNKEVCSNE